jgi:hypothetical protein
MERVHQLIAAGDLNTADDHDFWIDHWHHIASAKVPLATKVAAYHTLKHRDVTHVDDLSGTKLYEMALADRAFVAELNLNAGMRHRYRLCVICIDDDVAALARYFQEMTDAMRYDSLYQARLLILLEIKAPRCIRFLLQDQAIRISLTQWRMSPLAQRLTEELVQPSDHLCQWALVLFGQSVKLVGMCTKDEELVALWLKPFPIYPYIWCQWITVMFARKLHALATPEQSAKIKTKVLRTIIEEETNDGYFELAWLFGLLGPRYPKIQRRFRWYNVSLFPALIFAMIVALCDGYLEVTSPEITATQKRFFALVKRLPMDLQALISLRLYGQAVTVIRSDKFNRALLAII